MSLAVCQSLIDTTLNHFAQVRDTRKGQLLFWAGSTGSGRSATLQELAHQMADDKSVLVVRGSFRDSDPPPAPLRQSIIELYGTDIFLTAASTIHPLAGIVAQLIAAVKPTRDLVNAWKQAGAPTLEEDPLVFRQVLLAACQKQPVMCLLSHYDEALPQWGTFWTTFTTEMAALPLLVVLTLEAPTPLPEPTPADPDSWKVGYYLCGTGRAQWYAVPPISREDLAVWIGLSDEAVLEQLWRITKGNPRWTEFLWEAWQTDGVVEAMGTGWLGRGAKVWQFTTDYIDKPFHPVDHILGQRLAGLGFSREAQLALRQVFSVGALQGRSFAAPAVIAAIDQYQRERQFYTSRFERDEMIDMLDEVATEDGTIQEELPSVLHPQGLWRYLFTSELVWLTLQRYGLGGIEHTRMSLFLAQQLEGFYHVNPHPIAEVLARLFKEGDNQQKAEHYRKVAEIPQSSHTLLLHCRVLVGEAEAILKQPQWSRFDEQYGYRLVSQLLWQCAHLIRQVSPIHLLPCFKIADLVARHLGDRRSQGKALHYLGWCTSDAGEKDKALDYYQQALRLLRAVGDQNWEAATLQNLGKVLSDLGENDKALEYYHLSLPLSRVVGNQRGQATTLHNIGAVFWASGENDKALDYYHQALSLNRAVGDQRGEAAILYNIGLVWSALGEKDKALDYFLEALARSRAIGERYGEGAILHSIGTVWWTLGDKDKSLDYYQQALFLRRDMGDRKGEAETLTNLSGISESQGNLAEAISILQQAITLREQVRHPQVNAQWERLSQLRQRQEAEQDYN